MWIGLWLAARSLIVLSLSDVFGYGEELQKACAGKAWLDGLAVPHHKLAYHYYEGGGFVISHLDALAFLCFGESLLSVKLVALVLGAAILAAGWGFCRRSGGLAAARIFALLFMLAPDSVQRNSLLTLGIHSHAILFMAWILALTFRLAFERDQRRRIWLAWGVSAGFGFYFSYQCALTIAISVATLVLVLRRDLWSRATAWGFLGLVIGLAPLLWMAAHVGSAVLDIHGSGIVAVSPSKLELIRQFFLSVFSDRGRLDSLAVVAVGVAPAIALAALARGAPPRLRAGARLVLANMALFCAAYVGSGFTVGAIYHYIVLQRLQPLWFLAVLALALGAAAAQASSRRWLRRLAYACVAVPALVGAADLARTVREGAAGPWSEHLQLLARTKGYVYTSYLEKLSTHLEGARTDKMRVMLGFREPRSTMLQQAITVAMYGHGKSSFEEFESDLRELGMHEQRGFWLGLGPLLADKLKGEPPDRVRWCVGLPEPQREWLTEAVGRWGEGDPVTQDRVLREGNRAIGAEMPEAYFRGLGHRIYHARGLAESERYYLIRNPPWALDRERAHSILGKCPDPPASILTAGYEQECIEQSLGTP
jgi:hypothetical protein